MGHPDVGVVGLGSAGSMALWHLAERGVRAVGFEQFTPGHDRGSAGGDLRVFRTVYSEGEEYVPLLLAAHDEWRRLEQATDTRLLELCGELTMCDQGSKQLQTMLRCIDMFNLEGEVLDASSARKRFPQHVFGDDEAIVFDRPSGFVRSQYAIAVATRLAEQLGAVVHRRTRVEAIEPDDDGILVRVSGRDHRFARLVVAPGPWVRELVPELTEAVTLARYALAWYPALKPALFAPDRFPVFARIHGDYPIYGTPSTDGCSVRIAQYGVAGTVDDPNEFDHTVGAHVVDALNATVANTLPGLIPEPLRASTYMEAGTADAHALVGAHPALPNVVLLSAFSGHGFKLAPVIGKIAAELALDGSTSLPIEHLAPARLSRPAARG